MMRRLLLLLAVLLGWPLAGRGADPKCTGSSAMIRFVSPEHWAVLASRVDNPTASEFKGLVATQFKDAADLQFGAPVWLPPRSSGYFWFAARVPPMEVPHLTGSKAAEIETLLLDTGVSPERQLAREALGLSLHGEGSYPVLIYDGAHDPDEWLSDLQRSQELRVFAIPATRSAMPPVAAAYDAVTLVVLAVGSPQMEAAPLAALRQWVAGGGRLWVLADVTPPELLARLLGNDGRLQVVDRTEVETFTFGAPSRDTATYHIDPPAKMVRVLASGLQTLATIHGYPALLRGRLGLGEVVITTMEEGGWYKARKTLGDTATQELAKALFAPPPATPLPRVGLRDIPSASAAKGAAGSTGTDAAGPSPRAAQTGAGFQGFLVEQLGYQVVPRSRVIWVLAGFCGVVLAVGVVLQRRRRLEYIGPVAVGLVVATSGMLMGLGWAYRGGKPLIVAGAQVGHILPGQDAVATAGILSVYSPGGASGPVELKQGGTLWPDLSDQSGHLVRLVTLDTSRAQFEGLQFRSGAHPLAAEARNVLSAAQVGGPLPRIHGRFGPAGFEGILEKGICDDLSDCVVATPTGLRLAANTAGRPDGTATVTCGEADTLELGEFIRGTILTSTQTQHQAIYQAMLDVRRPGETLASPMQMERPELLGWTERLASGVDLAGAAYREALVVAVPIVRGPSAPGSRVVVPRAFVTPSIVREGLPPGVGFAPGLAYSAERREWQTSTIGGMTILRFQVPPEVLPLRVEEQKVRLRAEARGRDVEVVGIRAGRIVSVATFHGLTNEVRDVTLAGGDVLPMDAAGGVWLGVRVSSPSTEVPAWTVHELSLAVTGTNTAPAGKP